MIGIDILEIDRIDDKLATALLTSFFNTSEVEYIATKGNSKQTIAGIFCCKEAVVKALGTGIGNGVSTKDITVSYTPLGQPQVTLSGNASSVLEGLGSTIVCSISHSATTAVAVAVIK